MDIGSFLNILLYCADKIDSWNQRFKAISTDLGYSSIRSNVICWFKFKFSICLLHICLSQHPVPLEQFPHNLVHTLSGNQSNPPRVQTSNYIPVHTNPFFYVDQVVSCTVALTNDYPRQNLTRILCKIESQSIYKTTFLCVWLNIQ